MQILTVQNQNVKVSEQLKLYIRFNAFEKSLYAN